MWESAVPVRYLEHVRQSRQTSSKGFARGSSGSCDCECGDGTTATDMRILPFLGPTRAEVDPISGGGADGLDGIYDAELDANGTD
jgi:hypothetical protein